MDELEDSVKTPLAVSIKINKFFSNRWLKIQDKHYSKFSFFQNT